MTLNTSAFTFSAPLFPPSPFKPTLTPSASARPVVELTGDIRQQAQATLDHLRRVNGPAQRLFRKGSTIVRRVQDPDTRLNALESVHDSARLGTELCHLMGFKTDKKHLPGPPETVTRFILTSEAVSWGLPPIESVVHTPFFDADGHLVQAEGYHPAQRVWLDTGSLTIPPISEEPSVAEVGQAKALLEELLVDCLFTDPHSRNNALAALLTPHVRAMVSEHIPMLLIMAERPGAGKTTLARIIGELATPGPLATLPEASSEEEWRKRILSVLRRFPRVVFVDNLNQPLDSSPLAGLITLKIFEDRALGGNQMEAYPNQALWMFTANNPQVSPELQRRTCLVQLGSSTAVPQNRAFKNEDLFEWMEAQRGRLLWAILTLVQFWVARGKPAGRVHEKGMRQFSQVLGGILEAAGYSGVLENMDKVRSDTGHAEEDMLVMMAEWAAAFGTAEVTPKEVSQLLAKHQLYPNNLNSHHPNIVGQMLKKRIGFVSDGFVLRRRPSLSNHSSIYRLEPL